MRVHILRDPIYLTQTPQQLTPVPHFILFISEIENRYRKVRKLHLDQDLTESRITSPFKPYHWSVGEYNTIKEYRTSMYVFEDHNELTHSLILLWSYYNIENRYIKVIRLHLDQNLTKRKISSPFEPYCCIVVEYNSIKEERANMHAFEDHNELTHSLILF